MIRDEHSIDDDECPKEIKEFIRTTEHIEFYDYIKRGQNGEVYFGHRTKLGDDVVYKFYLGNNRFDESEEAVILKRIDHPYILKVDDLRFIKPQYSYFVSPRIQGGDLQECIESKAFSTRQCWEITAKILEGVNELHAKHKLVHRDLKPGNILIDTEKMIPVIADLGSVKLISDEDGFVRPSQCTHIYLPPEATLGRYTFQSDIYQVGIILFQMLGGRFPVTSTSPRDWLRKAQCRAIEKETNSLMKDNLFGDFLSENIRKGKHIDIESLPTYVSDKAKRILRRAFHKNLEKRYLNSAQFLSDVQDLMRSEPSYLFKEEVLQIVHDDGDVYHVLKAKDRYEVKKECLDGSWRKKHKHDGTMRDILRLVSKN